MQLLDLVGEIQRRCPSKTETESLVLCLIVLQRLQDGSSFEEAATIAPGVWATIQDQLHAVSSELDDLAKSEPCEFSPTHIWTLLRAIKCQSRMIDLLLGSSSTCLS